jgi:CRP-like cAMP-binding protein
LVGVSIAAEYVQAMFGRMFEYGDMIANAAGVSFGLFVGLTIRFLYGYIRKELTFAHIRKNLLRFDKGEMILKQGDPQEKFYLIKKGKVDLYRTVEVERDHVLTVGPGETIGALGVILGETQYTDAVASEYTEIYGLGLDELMDSAGGKDQPVSLLLLQAAEYVKKTNEEIVQLRKK